MIFGISMVFSPRMCSRNAWNRFFGVGFSTGYMSDLLESGRDEQQRDYPFVVYGGARDKEMVKVTV
jgi:hypothetical protein